MANQTSSIVIKRYSRKRLYDAAQARYVQLDELQRLQTQGFKVVVKDAETGQDVTEPVLGSARRT